MNEYELTVSSKIEKEYFIEADCYEDAIQKAVDYYLADNEEAGENKITNIKTKHTVVPRLSFADLFLSIFLPLIFFNLFI